MRRLLAAATAAALICGPVAAEPDPGHQSAEALAARLAQVGTFDFSATKRGPDGKPECHETWAFNPDGTGVIISGRQRVTTRWTAAPPSEVGQFIFINNLTTTDGPDCLGRPVEKSRYPYGSIGVQLLFYGDGKSALVCPEGDMERRSDGSIITALDPEDCWGRIVPAVK